MRVKLDDFAKEFMPRRAHDADAGYDIFSPEDVWVPGNRSVTIDTGVHVQIPALHVGFLKSKSGLNTKHGITGEGVIDSGYTGSIRVKLFNHTPNDYEIHRGDKIIQLVILPIVTPELELVAVLEETERGDNGFGSTGI